MEKIRVRYSGRGRQGRGGGRGYGRGRGAPWRGGRGNGTWVRSRDEDNGSVSTIESLLPQGSESPTSETSSLSSSGPILSGPRNHGRFGGPHQGRGRFGGWGRGRGRMNYHQASQTSWRREEVVSEAKPGSKHDATTGNSLYLNRRNEGAGKEETATEKRPTNVLARVGKNKLVLSTRNTHSSSNQQTESNEGQVNEVPEERKSIPKGTNNLVLSKGPEDRNSNPTERVPAPNPTASDCPPKNKRKMMAQGSNKLILSKSQINDQGGIGEDTAVAYPPGPERTAFARGTNKLVVSKTDGNNFKRGGKEQLSNRDTYRSTWSKSNGGGANKNKSYKRPISQANGPTVKRVKIGGAEDAGAAVMQKGETNSDDNEPKGKDTMKMEMFTDFAYRESHRGGRFAVRGGQGVRRQNMGLVRVNPDDSKTPICKTFLRGIRCEKEHCTKRHDVPRESAMPVCSFFQRHGQCLKGDKCPFRHVKVNPMAVVCPSFNLLGYCDDEKCVMKHETASKSAKSSKSANTWSRQQF